MSDSKTVKLTSKQVTTLLAVLRDPCSSTAFFSAKLGTSDSAMRSRLRRLEALGLVDCERTEGTSSNGSSALVSLEWSAEATAEVRAALGLAELTLAQAQTLQLALARSYRGADFDAVTSAWARGAEAQLLGTQDGAGYLRQLRNGCGHVLLQQLVVFPGLLALLVEELAIDAPEPTDPEDSPTPTAEADSPEPSFTSGEKNATRRQARALFVCGHHAGSPRIERENCGACCLRGYAPLSGEDSDSGHPSPNYAGWERAYVQAGYRVPAEFSAAFSYAFDRSGPYAEALREDVSRFGSPRHPTTSYAPEVRRRGLTY